MVILDANILIRVVLGRRVRELLEANYTRVRFFTPETAAIAEAREHLPGILLKRGFEQEAALATLDELTVLIDCVDTDLYGPFEATSRLRLKRRDEEDWPVLAAALALNCAIWTEDSDFFGAGVATWTTDRIELVFREASPDPQ